MNSKSISENQDDVRIEDCLILIVGPRKLQNELMVSFIGQETGAECLAYEQIDLIQDSHQKTRNRTVVILMDCLEKGLEDSLIDLESVSNTFLSHHHVMFFNVTPDQGIEEHAVRKGVRGVFYSQDPLEHFPKGVRAILNGELWISREVMSRFIIDGKGKELPGKKKPSILTPREIEIISMVAAGAMNEEIAEELYISPNTVKTHIYNIFKKINVPNRLQAALWAAKNL